MPPTPVIADREDRLPPPAAPSEDFRDLGFRYVTLDLEGFRSGSLNAVVPVEALVRLT